MERKMNDELKDKICDDINRVASMTDEYFYTFIEKLGGENLRGKDETYIKTYIDANFKCLTLIREPIDELKGVYHTYITLKLKP